MALKKKKTSSRKAVKKVSSKTKKSSSRKAAKGQDLTQAYIQVAGDRWPLERDVFFRPERFRYVRKLIKQEGCVFCRAHENDESFDTLCVYKTKHTMVLLNKFPYNSGHLLVLPRRHCGDLLQLSSAEFADLNDVVRAAMRALNELYQPGGINLGMNHGAVAGAGIPEHLHYHLVPRWAGDLNFFPLIAETKVLVESLEQTYDRLFSYFKAKG